VRAGTVKSRASRARKRLAARLPEFDPTIDHSAVGGVGDNTSPGAAAAGNPPLQQGVEPGATYRMGREEGNR